MNKEQKAAIEFINIALKLNPKSLLALLIKTEVLLEMGKKADVEKEVKKILAIQPDIFKSGVMDDEDDDTDVDDDYEKDEDADRTEDDEIEEFDLDD